MIYAATSHPTPSAGRVNLLDTPSIFAVIAEAWTQLRNGFFDTYRPELHYMRGPGPKWREKHGAQTRSGVDIRTLRRASLQFGPRALDRIGHLNRVQ